MPDLAPLSSFAVRWRAARGYVTFATMRLDFRTGAFVLAACLLAAAGGALAASPPPLRVGHAAVASDNVQASAAGLMALRAGGNAVDAACAAVLALGVVHPFASGIGGGGFALVYQAKERRIFALDFRERAPGAIRAEMFIKNGKADPKLSSEGALAVGVPGEVRGLGVLVRRFGKLPFSSCVVPAERLARGQARVSWRLAEVVAGARKIGKDGQNVEKGVDKSGDRSGERISEKLLEKLFDKAGGRAPTLAAGEQFSRSELARTLSRLRVGGADAFYKGEIAAEVVNAVRDAGGVLTREDLESYAPTERTPIEVRYRGLRVLSMPPPSSGGAAVAETLGILAAKYPDVGELEKLGPGSSAYLHVLAEAMKHAFADRARHLGDPDFVKVPTERLLSAAYHAELARRITDDKVGPSDSYGTPDAPADLHRDGGTAHVSVVDAEGNAVALTSTINLVFGAKLVAGKTGVLLNDQMDDFAMQPGVPNGFGLVGNSQNAVAPGKRPLSSMSPTIVLDGDEVKLVVGAAGGPRIITATTQVLLNVVDWKMDAQAAIAAPRVHHQWFPEILMIEPEIARDVVDGLSRRGHKVKQVPHLGVSNLIVRAASGWQVAAEPRSPSTPAGY